MPFGMTISSYFRLVISSFIAMGAGSQSVHMWYRPDLTVPEVPPKKGELHTQLYMPWDYAQKQVPTEEDEKKE